MADEEIIEGDDRAVESAEQQNTEDVDIRESPTEAEGPGDASDDVAPVNEEKVQLQKGSARERKSWYTMERLTREHVTRAKRPQPLLKEVRML